MKVVRFQSTHALLMLAVSMSLIVNSQTASARVRLKEICTVHSADAHSNETGLPLIGYSVVVGLNGTGDESPLASSETNFDIGLHNMSAGSIALVVVEAAIPETGISKGQKFDCVVSCINGATSLNGGRLLPVQLSASTSDRKDISALAWGSIEINKETPTGGVISGGAKAMKDFNSDFVHRNDETGEVSIELVLNQRYAHLISAANITEVLNQNFPGGENDTRRLANAVNAHTVHVTIPKYYHQESVEFASHVLNTQLDFEELEINQGLNIEKVMAIEERKTAKAKKQVTAKIIIDEKTETVVMSGDALIETFVIVLPQQSEPVGVEDFRNLTDVGIGINIPLQQAGFGEEQANEKETSQAEIVFSPITLRQLMSELNQRQVPMEQMIEIIKQLHGQGKLSAELIFNNDVKSAAQPIIVPSPLELPLVNPLDPNQAFPINPRAPRKSKKILLPAAQ